MAELPSRESISAGRRHGVRLLLLGVLSMLGGPAVSGQTEYSGRIFDAAGAPLAGVEVTSITWVGNDFTRGSDTRSDAEGRFSLKGPARIRLRFEKSGYIIAGKTLMAENLQAAQELEIVLLKSGWARGRIVDQRGRAVEAARVSLWTGAAMWLGPVRGVAVDGRGEAVAGAEIRLIRGGSAVDTRSDSGGRFEFPDVRRGKATLTAEKGLASSAGLELDLVAEQVEDARLILERRRPRCSRARCSAPAAGRSRTPGSR